MSKYSAWYRALAATVAEDAPPDDAQVRMVAEPMKVWTERPWLSDLLACPVCLRSLDRRANDLSCPGGHAFPIIGAIPRFTPRSSYADSFGFEWGSFPSLQLDTDKSHESAYTFQSKTGLGPGDVSKKTVLDAGCGMGRFTDVVARWGAARVVGVDISRAVDAAAENLRRLPSVGLAQADLLALPFPPGTFDVVFSIGVLHHTPNTFESFVRISTLVKPGGTLAVWVYSTRLRKTLFGSEVLRPLTSRMPPDRLLKVVQQITPKMRALKRRLPIAKPAVDFVLPTSNHPDPEWQILDTFDWYSPRYQWKHTYQEVEDWFTQLGFESVERLDVPVAVRGRRPS